MNIKNRVVNKRALTIFAVLLLIAFILFYRYNASTSYFGLVEIRELQQNHNEFLIVVESDVGVKTSTFQQNDDINIVENEESREGIITEVWDDLSENEAYHVLMKSYNNRDDFDLESIYID